MPVLSIDTLTPDTSNVKITDEMFASLQSHSTPA